MNDITVPSSEFKICQPQTQVEEGSSEGWPRCGIPLELAFLAGRDGVLTHVGSPSTEVPGTLGEHPGTLGRCLGPWGSGLGPWGSGPVKSKIPHEVLLIQQVKITFLKLINSMNPEKMALTHPGHSPSMKGKFYTDSQPLRVDLSRDVKLHEGRDWHFC